MESEITIRPERPEEFALVCELICQAFRTAKLSDGDEHDYVERLRREKYYIPSLALVAETAGKLVGQVMLTRTFIRPNPVSNHHPEPFRLLLLAPLSVKRECRGQGLATRLVQEAFDRARALGWSAVILIGDPDYYGRFGFVPASRYGIYAAGDREMYEPYLLVYELIPGALEGVSGTFAF